MSLSWDKIQDNAVSFSKRWEKAFNEEAQSQTFLVSFLQVFGVTDPENVGNFEFKIPLSSGKTGYVDYLWKGKIAIEMKSKGKDLKTAFEQLKNYLMNLPIEQIPDLWLVSDFENMRLYRRSANLIYDFKTKDLKKHIRKFAEIAGYDLEHIRDNLVEVNKNAAEKMAKLYDELKSYGYTGHNLEVYLVRLLFCLFADDTGIFPQDTFYHYINNSKIDGSDLSERIGKLFEVLNMDEQTRSERKLLSDELRKFRYINGSLFAELLPTAEFNRKMRQILLDCIDFDWSKISPAIFGAMFQGVMNKEKRRELGAHYTSEENILKLINPLFMDGLWQEFEKLKADKRALDLFHTKISKLKFLDPACGCGNFLIITYRELRLLEFEILKMKVDTNQLVFDISPMLKVNVEQFYGIEYEEFPCQIATVGMWLIDHQMNLLFAEQFGTYYARLPLTQSAKIVHGNALRLDWQNVVPKQELSYILGNPPFRGARRMEEYQKADMLVVFGAKYKNVGNLDYVSAWYKRASDYIQNTMIRCAFVSTNSITQGGQVAILWEPLTKSGIYINFGVPTFVWNNEAKGKAAVHCVIIGFSQIKTEPRISPYLTETPMVFIDRRKKPICPVPELVEGNHPGSGMALYLTEEERSFFILSEPLSEKYIRPIIGAYEFLNNKKRYCLWLLNANPTDLKKMPLVVKRIEIVRQTRLANSDKSVRRLAETPTLFREMINPKTAIVVPINSTERRKYIPLGFIDDSVITSNKLNIIPNATLYHFGILTSNVHMAWMRAVGGKLKSDYNYSKELVYNCFPWAGATDTQKVEIEKLAQVILDTRANYPTSSLADLYDPLTMPPELLKAHQNLDKAVMKLYGFLSTMSESDCVAELMKLYQQKTK
ncbi:MAG: class I SAM-dependent DNA methyltransferase [Firmicutes bacterium]|nr:class I SAM-dependent DNA methyltransferase [Bacillota bacterium]